MNPLHSAAADRLRSIASSLDLSPRETQRYSLLRALAASHFGESRKELFAAAAFERECSREIAKRLRREDGGSIFVPLDIVQQPLGQAAARAMSSMPGSKGGYLVGVEQMSFVDMLRARSVAYRMGARSLTGLTNNLAGARQTGTVSVAWQGPDGSSVSATDLALGQLSMTPKTCIAITEVSEQLLALTGSNADEIFGADLAAAVAVGLDSAVINGIGGAQPLGIKNTTGVTSNQDTAAATLAKILALPAAVGTANALKGRPGFVTNTAGAVALMGRQKFTGSSSALWEGSPFDGELVGIPAMSSEQLTANNLVFGCWEEIIIGEWGVLELATNRAATRFNLAQVGVRAYWMVDVLVRYPQSFIVSTNLS
jgi:HK97 family phage major capsid protein